MNFNSVLVGMVIKIYYWSLDSIFNVFWLDVFIFMKFRFRVFLCVLYINNKLMWNVDMYLDFIMKN